MRKVLLALFTLGACLGVAKADTRSTPVNQMGQSLPSFDYGGVTYATSVFSSILTTVPFNGDLGDSTVYGVIFSTGLCGNLDRVDIFDSTGAWSAHNSASQRASFSVYNVNNSTSTGNSDFSGACFGFSGLPVPVRFKKGLFFKPSSAGYNSIFLLYHRDGD